MIEIPVHRVNPLRKGGLRRERSSELTPKTHDEVFTALVAALLRYGIHIITRATLP